MFQAVKILIVMVLILPSGLKGKDDFLFLNLDKTQKVGINLVVDSSKVIPDYPDSYTKYEFNFSKNNNFIEISFNLYDSEVADDRHLLHLNKDNFIIKREGWLGARTNFIENYEYRNDTIVVVGVIQDPGMQGSDREVVRSMVMMDTLVGSLRYLNNQYDPFVVLYGGCIYEEKKSNREFYLYNEDWEWIGCFDIEKERMLDTMRKYSFKDFTNKFVWNEEYEEYFNKRLIHEKNSNYDKKNNYYINGEPAYDFFKDKLNVVPEYVVITVFPDFYFTIKVK